MLKVIYSIATVEDISSVLALQELYLVANLSEEEKKDGFVTTPFTVLQLQEVLEKKGLFVAKENNELIAYLFAGNWDFYKQWPIFEYMIQLFPTLSFLEHAITTNTSFQYGPICIHKNYRGKGIIKPLFEIMREQMSKKYSLALTFINKTNIPSTKAHTEKLDWSIIADFQFNNNDYHILAYDMKQVVH